MTYYNGNGNSGKVPRWIFQAVLAITISIIVAYFFLQISVLKDTDAATKNEVNIIKTKEEGTAAVLQNLDFNVGLLCRDRKLNCKE